jgi:type 1 fimbria pilin
MSVLMSTSLPCQKQVAGPTRYLSHFFPKTFMRTLTFKFVSFVALLGMASFAQAQSANVNVTGTIQPATCNFQINNGVNTVSVGTFNIAEFNAVGHETNPPVSFPLVISNCGPMSKLTLAFTGVAATAPGGASYWANGLGSVPFYLKNGTTVIAPNTGNIVITSGFNQTITFTAGFHQLVQPLTATAVGAASAAVTINISYQ